MPSFCCMRNSISKDLKLVGKRFSARDWMEVNDDSYDSYLIKIKT